ncbi:hypothetical protein RJ640_014187 [Escallonia rubra]|uniref:Uncharacterized protein n=1 Tax=Escallonia rubra TaxID=112253 RepID=A0AA88R723_9ASTE|nr:hypothetical protein RJ640_014187 [Escallonia rubra]
MHYWVRASASDFGGTLPQPRRQKSPLFQSSSISLVTYTYTGDSSVLIHSLSFCFFRLAVATLPLISASPRSYCSVASLTRNFSVTSPYTTLLGNYDTLTWIQHLDNNRKWFQPECTGVGSDGQLGPSPRAFHIAIAIDSHMFIFGGRSGSKRLGDFWVLDTDIWQWSELTSFGDLPSPRDFAAASAIGNRKIVMYGGWDGKRWLSDVYILDTISLEWMELPVSGALPPPRCGHTATMIEKRLLVYGGRGGGGPIMGDLWALKGLIEEAACIPHEENETPGWAQLKLPGQVPSSRCGHTVTSGGHYLLLFGGHGTGGWLSRYDIYYNDTVVLDRVSVQWKRLPTSNEPPPARAYHSMTFIGSRYLLFGGFDGKSTYGDLWWLVPEEDPIAKRMTASPPKGISETNNVLMRNDSFHSASKVIHTQENQMEVPAVSGLTKRLGISLSLSNPELQVMDESEDTEFLELALGVIGERPSSYGKDLNIEIGSNMQSTESGFPGKEAYRFYHFRNASQLRMDDIPSLLADYRQLLSF